MPKSKQKELWAPVKGYPLYEVSTLGRIRNIKTNLVLRPQNATLNGYYQVRLYNRGKSHFKYVHRVAALAWIPNPYGLADVDHLNQIKSDNKVSNLMWMSHKDNCRKSWALKVFINIPR